MTGVQTCALPICKGIHKDDLEKLNNGVSHDRRSLNNIGISNINERIKLYYGQDYGLVIKSEAGEGTTVEVTIPLTYADPPHDPTDREDDHDKGSNR